MGLRKCPECGHQISTKATVCPQCGAPRKRSRGCLQILGLTLVVFVVVGIIVSKGGKRPSAPATIAKRPALSSPQTAPVVGADDPLPSDQELEAAIKDSDDYERYREAFIVASRALLHEKRCSIAHLRENGGWVRSQAHADRMVYFTYCGGPHVSNRIYVDVSTGEIFR